MGAGGGGFSNATQDADTAPGNGRGIHRGRGLAGQRREVPEAPVGRRATHGPTVQPSWSEVPSSLLLQGRFQGLDLNEELYLGGYPNYASIAKTGLSSGFIGEKQAVAEAGCGTGGVGRGSLHAWRDVPRMRAADQNRGVFNPNLLI